MDLTNFIWHLGASLAALWAGLAYRSLKLKLVELEHGVLASLLENVDERSDLTAPALQRRRVSVRARALRWFSAELERKLKVQVEFLNRQALYDLMQGDWSLAVRQLSHLLTDEAFFKNCAGGACQLIWCSDGAMGRWSIDGGRAGEHG